MDTHKRLELDAKIQSLAARSSHKPPDIFRRGLTSHTSDPRDEDNAFNIKVRKASSLDGPVPKQDGRAGAGLSSLVCAYITVVHSAVFPESRCSHLQISDFCATGECYVWEVAPAQSEAVICGGMEGQAIRWARIWRGDIKGQMIRIVAMDKSVEWLDKEWLVCVEGCEGLVVEVPETPLKELRS